LGCSPTIRAPAKRRLNLALAKTSADTCFSCAARCTVSAEYSRTRANNTAEPNRSSGRRSPPYKNTTNPRRSPFTRAVKPHDATGPAGSSNSSAAAVHESRPHSPRFVHRDERILSRKDRAGRKYPVRKDYACAVDRAASCLPPTRRAGKPTPRQLPFRFPFCSRNRAQAGRPGCCGTASQT
jgi:hypothetical protein